MSSTFAPANSLSSSSGTNPSNALNVREPTISSDPNQPQTTHEMNLMTQLEQMGFTDRQEMINGIRQSNKTTAEDVMLFIIAQREEAEEARKEDEVRLISEEQKREQEQLQKTRRKQNLCLAKTGQDLRAIFGNSWILKGLLSADNVRHSTIVNSRLMTKRRTEFLDMLDLEEKSAKWYGALPFHYFDNVCNRMKLDHGGTIAWLPVECEKLRRGLNQLKEQKGGRPKLFVDAYDKATGSNDAEVIVIE
jgi:hypothetical protein